MRNLYLCLLFLSFISYSQNNKNLKRYYSNINSAELSIVDNNLTKAKEYYDKAFKTGYAFPIDKYNAFRVSYVQKDTVRSITYFNDLARLGQDKNKFILYFLHLDELPKDAYLDYVTKDYESIHSLVMKSELPLNAKKVDAIKDKDQDCRNKDLDDMAFYECNAEALKSLYNYIDTNGFPGPENTGLMENMVVQGPNPGTFDLMFWHARYLKDEKIYTIAYDNMKKGIYDARKFARGLVNGKEDYIVSTTDQPITKTELKKINKKRAEIYLEPLEDHSRKIEFMRKQKMTTMDYWFVDPLMYGLVAGPPIKIIE